ncbi:nitrous oxide reductase accessory protein NosL [Rhodoblastus sp.]|uniref:nitrous oxide reductase accessory protein NosL n=1 Tax=Rhodoblastus sp. TaxID=1962975 RepID=UPI003F9C0AB0
MFKRLAPIAFLVVALAACQKDKGPVEIIYGRDTCEMCGMIISEPRYAAEVRVVSDNKTHKFDDVGDAVNWLELQGVGLLGAKEIWVMDSEDGKTWLDARHAFYRRGRSPMNYNFAAVATPREGAVDFMTMRRQVLKQHDCGRKGGAK